jgi:S1-C subfamily serine protease
MPDEEAKVQSLGTIIDPTGLVITALSQIDPAGSVNGRTVRTQTGTAKLEAVSVLKDVKITLADGTDVPAEVVYKDTDLDLAFIRVKADSKEAKGLTFPAIDLKDSATGKVLDETVTITRMEETFNRVPNVVLGEVNMITKKPRVFLRAFGATVGCPTFNLEGKILGITAMRLSKGRPLAPALIPAADVLEVMQNIGAAKPTAAVEVKPKAAAEAKAK